MSMRRRPRRGSIAASSLVLVLAASACGGGHHEHAEIAALEASGAWARVTPTGATDGVVYLEVASPDDDAIVAASVPATIASAAQLHETTTGDASGGGHEHHGGGAAAGGLTSMAEIEEVALPADEVVTFEPGGRHVMLVGLVRPLVAGSTFPLTLTLRSGATLVADVTVRTTAP